MLVFEEQYYHKNYFSTLYLIQIGSENLSHNSPVPYQGFMPCSLNHSFIAFALID